MKQEKIDRRIKYTKHALQEAMIELLETHPIAKISVSMLCEKADVNRSTFYATMKMRPSFWSKWKPMPWQICRIISWLNPKPTKKRTWNRPWCRS